MQRRFPTLVVLSITVLAIVGMVSASVSPLASPARAQDVTSLLTPPSFENQRGVIGVHPIPKQNGPPIFAISDITDPTAFPTTTVRVHNYEGLADDQRFWLSVRIRQQDPGVDVVPEPGYAQMELIAPGGDAEYTVTFPDTGSAQVEFEVDGSTEEAAMLTILQFALESGLTAAKITGLGSHSQELGLALAEVVAEQYLADLPTLTPCANAVAAVQRGLTDQDQFTSDVQGCLESPIWQVSVDQVLARVAERDWFQQSLDVAGMAVPQLGLALKAVEATQFAARVWTMYHEFHPEVPGAMVGTVAFLSVDTTAEEALGESTAPPASPMTEETDLTADEILARAFEAVKRAGTLRFQLLGTAPSLSGNGEANFAQQAASFVSSDGNSKMYTVGSETYFLGGGRWSRTLSDNPMGAIGDLTDDIMELDWMLQDTVASDGTTLYIVRADSDKMEFWIDATTFLPVRWVADDFGYALFSDFGASIHEIQIPQIARENADLNATEIIERAIEAIKRAGSFRFQTFILPDEGDPMGTGEVNLAQQEMLYEYVGDQAEVGYKGVFVSDNSFKFLTDKEFVSTGEPKSGQTSQPILLMLEEYFLSKMTATNLATSTDDGEHWYYEIYGENGAVTIDTETFLPYTFYSSELPDDILFTEIRFYDFGASIDVGMPSETSDAFPTSTSAPMPTAETAAQATDAAVPMIGANPAHTGEMPGPGPQSQPVELWRTLTNEGVFAAPVVADGSVFVGTADSFFALDATSGVEIWDATVTTDYSLGPAAAVVNGVVYQGLDSGTFRALDAATGVELWSQSLGERTSLSPAAQDGVVYVIGGDGNLYALDAESGVERWRYPASACCGFEISPAIGEGVVYLPTFLDVTGNGTFVALDSTTGAEIWRFVSGGPIQIVSSPVVADGLVYFGTASNDSARDGGGDVFAVDAMTGFERWHFLASDSVGSLAVASGTVYAGSYDGQLYALDATTGEEQWGFNVRGRINGGGPSVVDGIVYVGTDTSDEEAGGTLYAIDAVTGAERWSLPVGDRILSSPAIVDGVIYAGVVTYAGGGAVVAIGGTTGSFGVLVEGQPALLASDATLRGAPNSGSVEVAQLPAGTRVALGPFEDTDSERWWRVTADEGDAQGWLPAKVLEPAE